MRAQSDLRKELDNGVPQLRFPVPFNVAEHFIDRHAREGRGAKVAVRTFASDITYAELLGNVNRYGNTLQQLGVGRGERLLMIVKDCPEFFYLFWGAIKSGVVPVPLNTLLRANDFAFIIGDSRCAGIVYSPEFAQEIEAGIAQSSWRPAHIFRLDDGEASWTALARNASPELSAVSSRADDDCLWLYSSGTTGRPKGVVHAHRNIVVTCQRYGVETLGAQESDVFFSVPRLYFSYGLGCAMTIPLWVGGTAVLDARRPTPQTVTEVFRRFHPTVFAAVPTFYIGLLAAGSLRTEDVGSLQQCISGGEATPPDLQRRWFELTGVPIVEAIGSTETLHIYMCNRRDDIRPGSLGKPVPGYQVKIVDEAGRTIFDDKPGRLWVKGQSLARCYWNDPEKTARTFVDGWMDTGDIMLRDQDGYYVYGGRADDMLKVSGRWISPFEIESVLIENPKVLEGAVIGRSGDDGLTQVEAWIVLKDQVPADAATADEIRAFCKSKLAPYKYPRWIRFVDQLPKTATGKIQRFQLRNSRQQT